MRSSVLILGLIFHLLPIDYAADENQCTRELEKADARQRAFNTRTLNAMARYLDRQRGRGTSPRTRRAVHFEDAVLSAYSETSASAAPRLGELLGVPPEVAEVAIAFYDLENIYGNDLARRAELVAQISQFFPLPEADRVPVNGHSIQDTWTRNLLNHSPAKAQFDAWKNGMPRLSDRNAGEDDGMWWKDIIGSVRALQMSQDGHPCADVDSFLQQESGRLWQLYGALVEREQIKSQAGDIIPGTAISVGGKRHADGWKVRWENHAGEKKLVITGLLESKSSFFGLVKAQDQIRGFLQRFVENAALAPGMENPPCRRLFRKASRRQYCLQL